MYNKLLDVIRKNGLSAVVAVAAIILIFYAGGVPDTVPASANAMKIPICRVGTEEKKVALSFDAAWGDEHLDEILDILDLSGVKSTFFVVGFWAEKYPQHIVRIMEDGHEIGSHSSEHIHMKQLSDEQIKDEIMAVADKINQLEPDCKTNLFRPPFGEYDDKLLNVCDEIGYIPVMWSVDSYDWKDLNSEDIENRVLKAVKPGDIILFHTNAINIDGYLPGIINGLLEQGYKLVPVGEILYKDNYYIDKNGEQIKEQ